MKEIIPVWLTAQQIVDLRNILMYNGNDRIKRFCQDSGIKGTSIKDMNPAKVCEVMEDLFDTLKPYTDKPQVLCCHPDFDNLRKP